MQIKRNKRLIKVIHEDNGISIVSSALSGTTGGALLGSNFGIVGGIIGSILGAIITGYSGYLDKNKIAKRRKESNT